MSELFNGRPVFPSFAPIHSRIEPVGSRITCTPPPINTDRDWLVLIAFEQLGDFIESLAKDGWVIGGSSIPSDKNTIPAEERFVSLTKGVDNLIITSGESFFNKFMAATACSKRLNLLSKDDRIALFQAVLYANGGSR